MGAVVMKKQKITGSHWTVNKRIAYLVRTGSRIILGIHVPEHNRVARSPQTPELGGRQPSMRRPKKFDVLSRKFPEQFPCAVNFGKKGSRRDQRRVSVLERVVTHDMTRFGDLSNDFGKSLGLLPYEEERRRNAQFRQGLQ